MAILFGAVGSALKRTTAIAPVGGDYTCTFWYNPTGTPSGGAYRTLFIQYNSFAIYTNWIGIFTGSNSNNVYLSIENGSGEVTTGNVTLPAGWTKIAYTRTGTTHRLYANDVLVGTLVVSVAAASLTEQWLGDDGSAFTTIVGATEYFREWTVALTLTEIQAEEAAFTAVRAANLFTDTPLVATGTLTDLSGNGHTWTAVGAISYTSPGPLPPANIDTTTAINLTGLLPYTASVNVQDASHSGGIWYKYTAQPSDVVIGAWALGAIGGYTPKMQVLRQDLSVFVNDILGNRSLQFSTIVGDTYYLKIVSAGNIVPATLTLDLLRAPDTTAPVGSLFVNDDTSVNSPGRPLALLSSSTGVVVQFRNPFPTSEGADVLRNGIILAYDQSPELNLKLYDANINLVTTIALDDPIISSNQVDRFYVCELNVGPTSNLVKTINPAGVIGSTTWALPFTFNIDAIAPSLTDTILYYNRASTNDSAIHRWDLVLNAAMTDLVADLGANWGIPQQGILVQADGTLVVMYHNTATDPEDVTVKHYSSSGTVLNTYSFGVINRRPSPPRITHAIDDPNSFWVWLHLTTKVSRFLNIKMSDGSTLATMDAATYINAVYGPAATATPLARFGHSESCPFLIIRASTMPPRAPVPGCPIPFAMLPIAPPAGCEITFPTDF